MKEVFWTGRKGWPAQAGVEPAIRELQELRQVLASDPATVLGDCTEADLQEIMAMVDACIDTCQACRDVLRFGRGV